MTRFVQLSPNTWRRGSGWRLEVEPLFGPMPDIAEYIQRGIARGTAFVIGPVGDIHGAMLLSRDGRPHHLIWLAVTTSARGHGYGKALVQAALNRWPG